MPSKILQRALYSIVLVSLIIPGGIIIIYLIYTGEDSVTFTFDTSVGTILILYYIILFFTLISLVIYWFIGQMKDLLAMRHEKKKAEIMLLQSEVNPHFFFNMLNNLYAMVDKDPLLAKEVILKLSDIMRYSIYEGKNELVTLKEEIDFINNYINLHKVRYHREIDVQFTVEVEDDQAKVTPLLFIILVENAFKHGIETITHNAFIHLRLTSDTHKITFEVENNFEKNQENMTGIGLTNLRRRLELLYAERSKFDTEIKDDIYYSKLEISVK
ncbi:sensor histidine kinase [Fulvivirga sedimenti]|uniref:Histidine kinase n=1 Tax=Fulvivirga sedimenti TaxID=2879465 RepID=A0A9X1HTP0_9BACT|nr:histidine kinase [Fulvivirga sedimenti]MCA6074473.1 histidine kinase [Fulvivirga sedimenti]MCA6075650.1 histidine kinase [Fulvivirga sedimenti]MCA6076778.1 histidine kinase [Fulvivirga sedimenti]